MMPGMSERRTRDYARHGTTSPFAAFNTADGTVIGEPHRHRATEFRKLIPRALHPDRIVVAQPGRALVRLPHPATAAAQRPQKRCGPGERPPQLGRPMEHQPTL